MTPQELPRLARVALDYLRAHDDGTGIVTASRQQLADALGVSGVSARNAIRTLEQAGLVTVSRAVGADLRPVANTYRLLSADVEG
jgi:Mn-dependent DtxR family transcriptional regulator